MAPKITLYGVAQVPFTEKCRRALVLKKLEFELREPSGPEDFRRWSPETGLLPVMTIDDERIADSTKILLRLEQLCPDPPLLSADPVVAVQQRQLEEWADESFLWYYQEWLRRGAPGSAPQPPVRERLRRRVSRVRARLRREPARTDLLQGVDDRLGDLENFLGTRPFFHADVPGMADLTVYAMLRSLRDDQIPGAAKLLAARPPLLAFMRRVEDATGG